MGEALPLPKSTGITFGTDKTDIKNKDIEVCAEDELKLCGDPIKLNQFQWPATDGGANYVLTTDGDGKLSFQSVGSVSASDQIVNFSGKTKVQTEATFGDETITSTANNKIVMTSTDEDTTSYNPFYFENRIEYKIRESKIQNDIVLPDDIFIRWSYALSSGTIQLPLAADYTGRTIIIENVSTQVLNVVVSGSDTINGAAFPIILGSQYSHVTVVGDGTSNWLIS